MDPATMSALIGAGSSVGGKIVDMIGGVANHTGRDARQQLDYAIQQSIEGKVKAARQAGISPLYALGAPVMSSGWQPASSSGPSLGETLSSMGQDVSRAVAARQSGPERQLQALALEEAALRNEFLRAQITSINTRTAQQAGPPAVPGALPENVQPVQATRPGANFLGMNWYSRPDTSDIPQYLEDHVFGDDSPLSWPIGALIGAAEADYNLSRRLPTGFATPAEAGTTVRRWLFGR